MSMEPLEIPQHVPVIKGSSLRPGVCTRSATKHRDRQHVTTQVQILQLLGVPVPIVGALWMEWQSHRNQSLMRLETVQSVDARQAELLFILQAATCLRAIAHHARVALKESRLTIVPIPVLALAHPKSVHVHVQHSGRARAIASCRKSTGVAVRRIFHMRSSLQRVGLSQKKDWF